MCVCVCVCVGFVLILVVVVTAGLVVSAIQVAEARECSETVGRSRSIDDIT